MIQRKAKCLAALAALTLSFSLTGCADYWAGTLSGLFPGFGDVGGTIEQMTDEDQEAVQEQVAEGSGGTGAQTGNENAASSYSFYSVADGVTPAIRGTITFTIDSATLYSNYYDAGFQYEDIYNPIDTYVVFWDTETELELDEFMDAETGELDERVGFLAVTLTVTNQDAVNTNAQEEYGNEYLFDCRNLFLVDWDHGYVADGETVIYTNEVEAFDRLNVQEEHPCLFELCPGSSITYQIGYFVDRSMDLDQFYLSYASFVESGTADNTIHLSVVEG